MVTKTRLRIDSVVAGGAGLAREAGGRVVFVEGALPGEEVDVEITDARRDFARGRVLDIITPSPDRRAPPCALVDAGCGGCGWQHIAHDAQLRFKEQIVADALRRIGRLHTLPEIATTHPAVGGARTTVRMAVAGDRLAFHMRASNELVTVDACMVSHPRLNAVIRETRAPGADEVLVRVSETTGEAIAIAFPAAAAARLAVPDGVKVGGAGATRAAGARGAEPVSIEEDVAGHRFRITADAFFQASPSVASALVDTVATAAGPVDGLQVVDAYAGVGLFAKAVAVAGGARSTTAIESHRAAAADARHNLSSAPARVVRCEVGRWRASPADVVIADPARPGLGKPGVRALVAAAPRVLVLTSCDAASLGRDARLLADEGFQARSVHLVDAFPHTPHVEAVTRFDAR